MSGLKRPFRLQSDVAEEHELQRNCTRMLERVLLPDVCWTAIDHAHSLNMQPGRNGVPIGLIEARKRKERGIKAGIPDYLFWHFGSFGLELKRDADSPLNNDQQIMLRAMLRAGVQVKVCWSIDQVYRTVGVWGLLRPGTVLR